MKHTRPPGIDRGGYRADMADTIIFDFIKKQVVLRAPNGSTRPLPEKLSITGTPAPTR